MGESGSWMPRWCLPPMAFSAGTAHAEIYTRTRFNLAQQFIKSIQMCVFCCLDFDKNCFIGILMWCIFSFPTRKAARCSTVNCRDPSPRFCVVGSDEGIIHQLVKACALDRAAVIRVQCLLGGTQVNVPIVVLLEFCVGRPPTMTGLCRVS